MPTVRLKAAGYQLSSPGLEMPKSLPIMWRGAIDWARPARARNWAMQIMNTKAISWRVEKDVAGAAPSGSRSLSTCWSLLENIRSLSERA